MDRPADKLPLLAEEIVKTKADECMGKAVDEFVSSEAFKTELYESVVFEFKDLEEKVKSHQQEMAELENNIDDLIAKQKELQALNDDIEQYTRRTNIRIFGILENKHEKTDELVKQFCKDELNIELKDDDISRSHRVGRTSYATFTERRPRPIIVHLTRHNKKVEILRKRRLLRQNHRNYSIQEDLTETRRSVLKYLQDLDIRDVVDKTWSTDGVIFFRPTSSPSTVERCTTLKKCQQIVVKYWYE